MEIDYLLLAEHAEVTASKLYLMGGGWDTMSVPEAPANVRLMLAAGVRVEWDETNAPVPLLDLGRLPGRIEMVHGFQARLHVGADAHLGGGA